MINIGIFLDYFFTPYLFGASALYLVFKSVLKLMGR